MNLYGDPSPFWEEEEEPIAVAPPPVPKGGWKTLEDIPDEDVKLVEPAAPAVPAGGWKTLEDIPDEEVKLITPPSPGKLPKMEVPEGGFKSLAEIPEEVVLDAETPKTSDASQWDDEDRAKWKALPPHQRAVFLREDNERKLFSDVRDRRAVLRDEEFKPPENWASLPREEKTRLQEDFSKTKQIALRGFDTAETEAGRGDIIKRISGDIPVGTAPEAVVRDELVAHARAAAMSPTRGVWDVLSGISNTLAIPEALARGIEPEETLSHRVAVAGREATRDLVGDKGDEVYAEVLRGLGSSITFAPAALVGKNAAVAAQGALTNFGDGYFEAKDMARMQGREASEAEAYTRAFAAAGIGTTEGIPFSRGLDRLEKIAGKGVIGRLIAMGKEGAEEWVQEYGSNVLQDTYDKLAGLTNKDWTDILTNVGGPNVAGFTGFLTALLMQGAQITAGRSRVPTTATIPGTPGAGAPAVPPAAGAGAVVPPGTVPPVVPPVVPSVAGAPGITITPAPGEVPVPPDLAGAPPVVTPPVVPPVVPPVTPVAAAVPPVVPLATTPDLIEPGANTPAGAAVTQVTGAHNIAVKEIADTQAQNLQAASAPKTAQAIQQLAQESSSDATVTAAEFLQQAKVQAAEAEAEAAAKAAPETPAAAPEAAAAVAPAPVAPASAIAPAIPAIPATPPAPAAVTPETAPAPAAGTEPKAAVVVGGQVFTGATPADARIAAHTAVGADAMGSAEGGWVDPETGRFHGHGIYEAHQALNTAIEQSGGDMEAPAVQEATTRFAEAQQRDVEINNQIVQPGGEQVVNPGIKGQEVLVSTRPSQELAVPLAGVTATVEGVDAQGRRATETQPAAVALNDARNDRSALTILLDCLH